MSARLSAALSLFVASAVIASPAAAASDWSVKLTQAPQPDGTPWEEPARIALTIDPNGPDELSAQVNLKFTRALPSRTDGPYLPRTRTVGGYIRWNRETGGDERQNNLEAGFNLSIHHNVGGLMGLSPEALRTMTPEQLSRLNDERARRWDFSLEASTGYARTAEYPDLDSATCVATPAVPQCQTQFNESLRTSAAVGIFNPHLAGNFARGGSYSIGPKFQIDHDLLLNSPINVDTGSEARGSYFSVLTGVGATISPGFLNPAWEVHAAFYVRQRIYASASRRPSIEATAEQFEASATYYPLRPPNGQEGWRLGVGVIYTRGGDPLTGSPDGDRIVLALRLGQF